MQEGSGPKTLSRYVADNFVDPSRIVEIHLMAMLPVIDGGKGRVTRCVLSLLHLHAGGPIEEF